MRRSGIEYQTAESLAGQWSKQGVEKFASFAAQQLHRTGSHLHTLIESLGGHVHYENPLNSDSEDGTIFVHGPNDFDVVLSSLSSVRRDAFTIAHELGHYFLHSKVGKHPLIASRTGSNRSEWEANWFAAGFLMPLDEFRECVEAGTSNASLAERFGVSEAAVLIRRKTLDI